MKKGIMVGIHWVKWKGAESASLDVEVKVNWTHHVHLHESTSPTSAVLWKIKSYACISLFTVSHAVQGLSLCWRLQIIGNVHKVCEASTFALSRNKAVWTWRKMTRLRCDMLRSSLGSGSNTHHVDKCGSSARWRSHSSAYNQWWSKLQACGSEWLCIQMMWWGDMLVDTLQGSIHPQLAQVPLQGMTKCWDNTQTDHSLDPLTSCPLELSEVDIHAIGNFRAVQVGI